MTRTHLRSAEAIRQAARAAALRRYGHTSPAVAAPDFEAAEDRTLERFVAETGAGSTAVVVLAAAGLVIEALAAQFIADDPESGLAAELRALAPTLWAPEITRPAVRFVQAHQGDAHPLVAAAATASSTPWAHRIEAAGRLVALAADHPGLEEYLGDGWAVVHGVDLLSIYGERATAADRARRAVVAMLAPALTDDGGRRSPIQRQVAAAAAGVSRPTLNGWLTRGAAE